MMSIRKLRESDVEKHLIKRARSCGGEVRKVRWIGRRGAPDRYLMFPWESYWVELKRPGQKLTAQQKREHKRMGDMGQWVVVLSSIEEIDDWFRGNLNA